MKALALTIPGLESVAAAEVEELLGKTAKVKPSVVLFDVASLEQLCTFAYLARSVRKVFFLFGEFVVSAKLNATVSSLQAVLADADLGSWLLPQKTFGIACERQGTHDFSSQDLARDAAAHVRLVTGCPGDLRQPDVQLAVLVVDDRGYLGIDVAGFALDKRDYHVFPHPADVRGNVAYGVLRLAGYTGKEHFMDAFCHSGMFAIEAGLFASGKSPHHYRRQEFAFHKLAPFAAVDTAAVLGRLDGKVHEPASVILAADSSMRNLRAAEKNAKIAGVKKLLRFSRLDTEWLDVKLDEGSVGCAVSQLPFASKRSPERVVGKVLEEFFYQLKYILAADGKAAFLVRETAPVVHAAAAHSFVPLNEHVLRRGEDEQRVIAFKKS